MFSFYVVALYVMYCYYYYVSIVFHGTFPGFPASPGLGMSSSPGSSLPRGGRGVMVHAPMVGVAGAGLPSPALLPLGGPVAGGGRGCAAVLSSPHSSCHSLGGPRPPPRLRGFRVFPLWCVRCAVVWLTCLLHSHVCLYVGLIQERVLR